MSDNRKACIEKIISQKKNEIKVVDEDFFGNVVGISQALGQLRSALDAIDKCLNQREFSKASDLGYSDVSSEFIFLQRCLGGLNDTVMQKEKIIQNICVELGNELDNIRYEEIAPFVELEIESLKPVNQPSKIDILLGEKTAEKLQILQNIRQTPIENLVENILVSAMQKNENDWQELEKNKPSIPNIKKEKKEWYTSEEVFNHLEALSKQHEERLQNLY